MAEQGRVPLLSFPPFRLDLDAERLWKGDAEVHLRRKPFAILRFLVHNPQRLVTHGEIVEAVWGKVAMSESLLRTHVRDLRQVLGDGVVETVIGRGYRFMAELERIELQTRQDEPTTDGGASRGKVLVGREAELDVLRAALRSARERKRTTVFVAGDAGMGKTTLIDFFVEQAGARSPVLVGRGACVEQYGSGQAYLPILDAIGTLCRGRNGDRVIEVFSKHAPTWLAQMASLVRSDRLEEIQRRAAGATQARTLRELAEALEALSSDAPVVIVLDDLQWTDASTAELLAILSIRREPARLLLLGTYRSAEVSRGHPLTKVVGELVAHRQASTIVLDGFGSDALEAYLSARFPGHRFPPELTRTLFESTGGNPLFLTTLLDDLDAQGLIRERDGHWTLTVRLEEVAARLPDSIRRLIDTQIDRLPAAEQRIIETAAIAGATFTAGLVAHALQVDADEVDSACESLANDRNLFRYVGTETWPDGTIQSRYAFGHALFKSAALARSTAATVRARHRKIAERLETGHPGHQEDVAAELAVHFEQGQMHAKAAQYHAAAGERAAHQHGPKDAAALFGRARTLLEGLPASRDRDAIDLRVSIGLSYCQWQLDGSVDAALAGFQRARELATQLDDQPALFEALVRIEGFLVVRGDLRDAGEYRRARVSLPAHAPRAEMRFLARELDATAALLRGQLEEALQLLDGLGALRREVRDGLPDAGPEYGLSVAMGAFAAWLAGRPDHAVRIAQSAYEAAERADDPFQRAAMLAELALLHAWRREPAKAIEVATRVLALSQQNALVLWQSRAETVLRWAEVELEAAEANGRAEELVAMPWGVGSVGRTMHAMLYIAMCSRLGRVDRALEVIATMLETVERTDERWLEPELHRLRGEALRSKGEPTKAAKSIATAIDIARTQGSRLLELRASIGLHALVTGAKKRQVREEIGQLLALITEGRDTPDLVEARAAVAGG